MRALDAAHKELGDLRDSLDRKKGERAELVMRREVRGLSTILNCWSLSYSIFVISGSTSSSRMPRRSSSVHSDMWKTSVLRVSRRSSGCNVNTRRWLWSDGTMTAKLRSCEPKRMTLSVR